MNISSAMSNLELLVFYLTKAKNPGLTNLENVRLVDKDKNLFNILGIQTRPLNPLLTLVNDFGTESLYSAVNLKAPYWIDCDLPPKARELLDNFRSAYLVDEKNKIDGQTLKQQKLFREKLESALSKHKKFSKKTQ